MLCHGVAGDGVEPCFDGGVNAVNYGGLVRLRGLRVRARDERKQKAHDGDWKTKMRESFHHMH
jgi:hypothetical protein